jgi:hypothetical protein
MSAIVNDAWAAVHKDLPADSRVTKTQFVDYHMKTDPAGKGDRRSAYMDYLSAVFDTATAMMLPDVKTDLGKHCFGYAHVLAGEFYDGPAGGEATPKDLLNLKDGAPRPKDGLTLRRLRKELDSDWGRVDKVDGRVTEAAFVNYFAKKYESSCPAAKVEAFKTFLKRDFLSATAMMKPEAKTTLGGHCFRYAAIMAGEFYFDAETGPSDSLKLK